MFEILKAKFYMSTIILSRRGNNNIMPKSTCPSCQNYMNFVLHHNGAKLFMKIFVINWLNIYFKINLTIVFWVLKIEISWKLAKKVDFRNFLDPFWGFILKTVLGIRDPCISWLLFGTKVHSWNAHMCGLHVPIKLISW